MCDQCRPDDNCDDKPALPGHVLVLAIAVAVVTLGIVAVGLVCLFGSKE